MDDIITGILAFLLFTPFGWVALYVLFKHAAEPVLGEDGKPKPDREVNYPTQY